MIPAIGVAIGAATAALTLKSDAKPIKIAVKKPRGTVYWGGAGLNGAYINDQIAALRESGIKHIWVGKRTSGNYPDAIFSGSGLRYQGRTDDRSLLVEGMEKVPAEQFNLIGYSYGSLMAAHTAHVYANNDYIVDHLVLIASPIDLGFLSILKTNRNIRKVIVIDLRHQADPIYAGMNQINLILAAPTLIRQDIASGTSEGIGHFYFRPDSQEGRERRRRLARYLHDQGLR